jgi:DNA-binding response OmpR family regulator
MPMAVAASVTVPQPAFAETTAPAPSAVRLLVVDDDERIRKAIATSMTRAAFSVFTADDGSPAMAFAEQTPPDLVIVDFNMPTPGLEVVRRLKERHGAAVWITVLTGLDDEYTRSLCFDAGADDVLAKPVHIGELKKRMLAAARTQQAYVETRLEVEKADRLLTYGSEASAMLAHDLNNGLAVALGNMTYLQGTLTVDPDEADALAATVRALRKMSGLVANFVDISMFFALKRMTGNRLLWLRATGSTAISQLIDTIVISALVWGGTLSFDQYLTVVLTSYLIKLAAAIGVTPVIYALHALIEKRFGIPPAPPEVASADISG